MFAACRKDLNRLVALAGNVLILYGLSKTP